MGEKMKRWKQFFQEKVVVSAVMCVLLGVVLTTATTAWYAINNRDSMFGLQLKTSGTGGIKVAVQPGGPDIMEDEAGLPKNADGVPIISINLADFENIEKQKIAPGAYGPLTFYITSLTRGITSYEIQAQLEYRPMDGTVVTAEQKQKIENMIRNHIFLYAEKYNSTDAEGKPIVLFRKPVSFYETEEDAEAIVGPLTFDEEKRVEVYWVWNYELTDIPNYQNTALYKQYDGNVRQAVRAYDEEDTLLGNCVKDIWINVSIQGNSREVEDSK